MGHIELHDVTAEEVEQVLTGPTIALERQEWHETEERFSEAGMTSQGGILQVISTLRGAKIRVVTAWEATEAVKQEYFASR